ncbi:MAG: hypothetical protein A2583_12795 [Bdellovibrionales bacterium RIFOXYD1_FULL_53_11]|nr:MAG: hypothetical protein A2583_12795 [Bdellovibrionales bacterium RIFOXYD1_FULL_53_11]
MKTITEFFGANLIIAIRKHQELSRSGKTPEEVQAEMGAAFKADGEKLQHLLNAIDIIKGRPAGLKRVVVIKFEEGEKLPQNSEKRGEYTYLFEYFPAAAKPERRPGRFGRDSGGRRGRGGRDDRRGGGSKPPGGDQNRNNDRPRGDGKPPWQSRPRKPDVLQGNVTVVKADGTVLTGGARVAGELGRPQGGEQDRRPRGRRRWRGPAKPDGQARNNET